MGYGVWIGILVNKSAYPSPARQPLASGEAKQEAGFTTGAARPGPIKSKQAFDSPGESRKNAVVLRELNSAGDTRAKETSPRPLRTMQITRS